MHRRTHLHTAAPMIPVPFDWIAASATPSAPGPALQPSSAERPHDELHGLSCPNTDARKHQNQAALLNSAQQMQKQSLLPQAGQEAADAAALKYKLPRHLAQKPSPKHHWSTALWHSEPCSALSKGSIRAALHRLLTLLSVGVDAGCCCLVMFSARHQQILFFCSWE